MTVLTSYDHGGYLSVAEVARELHCSEPTVRRRIRSGELPAVQLGGPGSALRVRRDELDAWLTQARRRTLRPRRSDEGHGRRCQP